MPDLIEDCFRQHCELIELTRQGLAKPIATAAELMISACKDGGGIYIFGNGGSAADAEHIVVELVGRFLKERPAIRAMALTTNTAVLTALANDYDFDRVFARQLEAYASGGDVAVAMSTSGNSSNIVAGLETARRLGMKTIVFSGQGGGKCAEYADVLLVVPSRHTPRIQEAHVLIYHILCELVENALA